MGVPSFFLWLAKKAPRILTDVLRREPVVIDGVEVPDDTSQPNANNLEIDNLYLDMNGIIHPCVHPENAEAPETVEEMIAAIFDYIDFVFSMVRPRKLLFMAIDGVAPRAKMNQQRSRRFKSIKEAEAQAEADAMLQKALDEELRKRGMPPQPRKEGRERFDHNVITPGTEFMDRVAQALRWYAAEKCSNDPGWKGIAVYISDATVPGEGEHKIMDFIRSQRTQPGYNPNTRHCIYGLDADLIMLALATHEAHFYILREVIFFENRTQCTRCGQEGHQKDDCEGAPMFRTTRGLSGVELKPFQFLSISVLKEYLTAQMKPTQSLVFEFSPERVCDDFVFLCFLVGNDFLPHLPTLEIREGAIDLLMGLYREVLPTLGGYITEQGKLHMTRAKALLRRVGPLEDHILQNRIAERSRSKRWNESQKEKRANERQARLKRMDLTDAQLVEHELRQARLQARYDTEVQDELRLGRDGWRDRYYEVKLKCEDNSVELADIACHFVDGMAWVLRYYYEGCCDWDWYYPLHYSPTARDLAQFVPWDTYQPRIANQGETEPFKPIQQLMAVLPPGSAHALPPVYANLMTSPDSPLLEYYPEEFQLDMEGKRFMWQAIAVLPFIDGNRLLSVLEPLEDQLTPEERARNTRGEECVFVGPEWPGRPLMGSVCASPEANMWFNWTEAEDAVPEGASWDAPVPHVKPLSKNRSLCVAVTMPEVDLSSLRPTLLPGAIVPPPILTHQELHNTGPRHGAAIKLLPGNDRRRNDRGGILHNRHNRPDIRAPRTMEHDEYDRRKRDRHARDEDPRRRRDDHHRRDDRRGGYGEERRDDRRGRERHHDQHDYRQQQRRQPEPEVKRARAQYPQPVAAGVTPQLSMIAMLQQYQKAQQAKAELAHMAGALFGKRQ